MSAEPGARDVPLFEVSDLKVHFPIRGTDSVVKALDGIDLEWHRGEVLGIVGESGCGKSTLGRTLMGLQPPTEGEVKFEGAPLPKGGMRQLRRRIQMVFQDPYQWLNPRMNVGLFGAGGAADPQDRKARQRADRDGGKRARGRGVAAGGAVLGAVSARALRGQRQRVVIAAALVLEPEGLVCDEPVSALDVSIRAQVIQLLMELKRDRNLGLIFITHDVGLAWALCDRVAVMYLGRVIEQGTTEQVLANPQHPYTKALLSVVPNPVPRQGDERRTVLEGELPDASNVPSGCRFHPRCPMAFDRCHTEDPADLLPISDDPGHVAACWLIDQSVPEPPQPVTTP